MKTTYDKEADAAYIYFPNTNSINNTIGDWPFHIDLDEAGEVVGIEVMDASHILKIDFLEKGLNNAKR